MPRNGGVFAFLGSAAGNGVGKTLLRVARRVVRVELGGDRRAAVREEVPVDALRRPRVAVTDGRGELEVVQPGLDQVAGGRVPALVRRDGIERVRVRLHPDDLRSLRVRVRRLLPAPGPQRSAANGGGDERVDGGATEN